MRQLAQLAGRTLCLFALLSATSAGANSLTLEQQFALFLDWFPGEYDNNEQVWQQREDGVAQADLHERIHHRFVKVDLPALGEHVYFVLQTLDDDIDRVYRQRFYRLEADTEAAAVRLDIFRMPDETRFRNAWQDPSVLAGLDVTALSSTPGCEVYWRYNGEYFDGTMVDGACRFTSPRSGREIMVADTLRLTDSEIWIGDRAVDVEGNPVFGRDTPHVNRKVRRFKGWMGVKKSTVNPDYAGDDMFFTGGVSIHNEGGRARLLDDEGQPTGYSIELAQLTYQQTRVPILKLGIIEEASGSTVAYTWTSTDASRIGVNLRWLQAGLTAVE